RDDHRLRTDSGRLNNRMDRLQGVLAGAHELTPKTTANGTSTINVNAAGMAVWIAATCCAVMLVSLMVVSVIGAVWFADINQQTRELRQKDDLLQAYINVAYGAQSPQELEE